MAYLELRWQAEWFCDEVVNIAIFDIGIQQLVYGFKDEKAVADAPPPHTETEGHNMWELVNTLKGCTLNG